MIIETRGDLAPQEMDRIRNRIEAEGLRTERVEGFGRVFLLALPEAPGTRWTGDAALEAELRAQPGVVEIRAPDGDAPRVTRVAPGHRTRVRVGDGPGQWVGDDALVIMAGPCSVEGEAMLQETARAVQAAGAGVLRGGAYKPRTSPWAFQGLGEPALEMLARARAATGMAVVTEVMDPRQAEGVAARADILQVGARNMQNFALLREVGALCRPVLLKRGPSATLREFLLAAEHLMAGGTREVILCERGIRTFETATRNTLDVSAIPVLKAETHLPVLVDPSHAGGSAALVAPLAAAALAAGADGLMVEVHPDPPAALSDGDQSLTPEAFAGLMEWLRPFAAAAGRTLPRVATAGARLRGAA